MSKKIKNTNNILNLLFVSIIIFIIAIYLFNYKSILFSLINYSSLLSLEKLFDPIYLYEIDFNYFNWNLNIYPIILTFHLFDPIYFIVFQFLLILLMYYKIVKFDQLSTILPTLLFSLYLLIIVILLNNFFWPLLIYFILYNYLIYFKKHDFYFLNNFLLFLISPFLQLFNCAISKKLKYSLPNLILNFSLFISFMILIPDKNIRLVYFENLLSFFKSVNIFWFIISIILCWFITQNRKLININDISLPLLLCSLIFGIEGYSFYIFYIIQQSLNNKNLIKNKYFIYLNLVMHLLLFLFYYSIINQNVYIYYILILGNLFLLLNMERTKND